MINYGLSLTLRAVQCQLAAMPCPLYELRLIHHATRKPWAGQRVWSPSKILDLDTIKFLRLANRNGYDVYIRPYAERQNPGYILIDLDAADPAVIQSMRAHRHTPCVVVASSPGHLQAWVRVSRGPLSPRLATAVARALAQRYQADPSSADWRHLGRLAGFTNQKPHRRLPNGLAPWVRVLHAEPALAQDPALLAGPASPLTAPVTAALPGRAATPPRSRPSHPPPALVLPSQAVAVYQTTMRQLRIPERFPQPNWSIVDKWIAKHLLSLRMPADRVKAILRQGSPGFPRAHANPEDYLERTLARALSEVQSFSARQVIHAGLTPRPPG